MLGQILLNETANAIILEHSFADQVFHIYQLSYNAAITIRKIVSLLFLLDMGNSFNYCYLAISCHSIVVDILKYSLGMGT